jgi:hypothetical protein
MRSGRSAGRRDLRGVYTPCYLPDMSETKTFGCWVPPECPAMAEDPPVWQAFWKRQAQDLGYEPVGEPTLIEHTSFGESKPIRWHIQGPVRLDA